MPTVTESIAWLAIAAVALWAARLGGEALARVKHVSREQLRRDVDGWDERA